MWIALVRGNLTDVGLIVAFKGVQKNGKSIERAAATYAHRIIIQKSKDGISLFY